MLGLVDQFLCSRSTQDRLDFSDDILRNIAGLGDVWLLGKVLAQEYFTGINRLVVIFVHRAYDQLRTANLVETTPGSICTVC